MRRKDNVREKLSEVDNSFHNFTYTFVNIWVRKRDRWSREASHRSLAMKEIQRPEKSQYFQSRKIARYAKTKNCNLLKLAVYEFRF